MADLKAGIEQSRDLDVLESIRSLESSALVKNLEERFSGEGTDFDALLQADREILEFKVNLDEIAGRVAWPSAVQEVETWLGDLSKLVSQQGTAEEKKRSRVLHEQIETIIGERNEDRLKKKMEEISDVYSAILYRQTSFWVDYFERLAASWGQMKDQPLSAQLIEQGRALVTSENLEELKNVVYQLQDMLPKKVVEQARRGYGSGLVT
jgi:molecular chaperone DnaK